MVKQTEILSKELGRTISYIDIPEPDARKGMMKMGMEDWLIDAMMECILSLDQVMDLKQLVQLKKLQGESQYCFHNLQRIMLKPLDKKKDVLPCQNTDSFI